MLTQISSKEITITCSSGMVINTPNIVIAKAFWLDGAEVEFKDGSGPVFSSITKKYADSPKDVYPVWLTEHEVDMIIAHWEKTGMFSTIVNKIRSASSIKKSK